MNKFDKTPSFAVLPFVYIFILTSCLLANLYLVLHKETPKDILASVGDQKFSKANISENAKKVLNNLEATRYGILKKEAENWAEKIILAREAQEKSKTPEQLLSQEVSSKVPTITEAMAYDRYAHSPAADSAPYPQVLKEIEKYLQDENHEKLKRQYLEGLYKKYNVNFLISPPAAYQALSEKFPIYQVKPASPDVVNGEVTGPAFDGPKETPVVIEVFSDFMCPFSSRFAPTLRQVRENYKDKVRIEYHHFPLPFHQGSDFLSQAAMCAQEQGKFWEYHDALMKNVGKKEKAELIKIAGELKLNTDQFSACLDKGKYKTRLTQEMELGQSRGVRGTPTFFINGRQSVGAMNFETIKPLIEWTLKSSGPYPGRPPAAPTQGGSNGRVPQPPSNSLNEAKVYDLPAAWISSGPAEGPQTAPITIVENIDYQCPFCERGAKTMNEVLQRYPGKIKIISKQFPLPFHKNAFKAAEAALCADEQGKYKEFREEAFGNSWQVEKDETGLKKIAQTLKLNESQFNACLDSEKYKARIQSEMSAASALGVQGTPTYFINGSPLVGAQPADNFAKRIDEKLGTSQKKPEATAPGKDQKLYA